MRTALVAAVVLLLALVPHTWGKAPDESEIYWDFGNLRPNYIYPTMNVGYVSPSLFETPGLKLDARMRSFGTLYVFNLRSYDFTALGEYHLPLLRPEQAVQLNTVAGVGFNGRLRLYKEATSSVEPLIAVGLNAAYAGYALKLPVWTQFFLDGVSFTALPEVSCRWGGYGVFWRSELSYLQRTDRPLSDWYWNNFVGLRFYWE